METGMQEPDTIHAARLFVERLKIDISATGPELWIARELCPKPDKQTGKSIPQTSHYDGFLLFKMERDLRKQTETT